MLLARFSSKLAGKEDDFALAHKNGLESILSGVCWLHGTHRAYPQKLSLTPPFTNIWPCPYSQSPRKSNLHRIGFLRANCPFRCK